MKLIPDTLFWRIYLIILLTLILPLLIMSCYVEHLFKTTYHKNTESRLLIETELVAEKLADKQHLSTTDVDGICKKIGKIAFSRITIIKKDGTVLGDSDENPIKMENHSTRPEFIAALKEGNGVAIRYSDTIKRNMMYVATLKNIAGEELIIRAAVPISSIKTVLQSFYLHIVVAAMIIILVLLLPTYLIARNVMLPLTEIGKYASSISQGLFHKRLAAFNCREIDELTHTMNNMAEQLENHIRTVVQQKDELETLLSAMTEGLIVVSSNETILRMNPAAASLLNIEGQTIIGRSMQEVIRNPTFQSFIMNTLNSKEIKEEELTIYGKPDRYLQLHGISLRDKNNDTRAALIVFTDISKVKRLETIRKDFVANVSHELKTPITSLKGCTETLSETFKNSTSEKINNFLEILKRNIARMEAIVNDLLTLARLEFDMEHSLIEKKKENLIHVINGAVEHLKEAASKKEIAIITQIDEAIVANINAPLLQQALENLLDNAIKYSPEKTTVHIGAEIKEREIEIKVADEGPGIPSQHLDRIFERFYRIDKARSRALGGTGLGLSIVKNIALSHGGSVAVQSQPGKGSVFFIHLPALNG
jgi:two-component system phosphate regulon sensor histidine kinase PhoR